MFACTTMRATVTLAAVLFLGGFFMQLPAVFAAVHVELSPTIVSAFGLAFMLLSLLVLLATAAVSLLPRIRDRLHNCQH